MKRLIFTGLLTLMAGWQLCAQHTQLDASIKTSKAVMDDFMAKRFGMFIHWGPVTLRGTEIGWSRNREVSAADYDTLYKAFNPSHFNADAWVKTAKDAGMQYLTITAKHHDGFCLWPTAYSDYNISHSPFKRDVVGELATACKKYGIRFCIYFTVLDWHDPDYPIHNPHQPVVDSSANMQRFVDRMKNELRELVTRYHPYMLWFDGNWESPWTQAYAVDVYTFLKKLDPRVIINNRLSSHQLQDSMITQRAGDYNTPEQRIGELDMDAPWESCMTIATQWAWKPDDPVKSLKECLQTLARTAGGNGNLLFNVGPMADGRIEPLQTERLRQMGAWLRQYGESIYGTSGGPWAPGERFAATRKGNRIYVHIFDNKNRQLVLPALPALQVKKAYFLKGPALRYQQTTTALTLDLPAQLPDTNDAVAVLELDGNAAQLPVIRQAKRYGMVTGVRPDKVDHYKQLHAAVWPGVLKTIQACNIRNYSIYLKKLEDRYYLFSYFEYTGNDFDADMKKMAADSTTQRWWKETAPTQLPLPEAAAKQQVWSDMEEVFHMP